MRVGILAGCLGRGDGGPETYERELIRALSQQDRINSYTIYVFEPGAIDVLGALPENFRVRVLWPKNRWINLLISLPAMVLRDGIEVLHATLYPPLVCPTKLVLTMHDNTMFTRPDFYSSAVYSRLNLLVRRGMRKASVVICISKDVMDTVLSVTGRGDSQWMVIPHGVNPVFRPIDRDAASRRVATELNIRGDYILYIGKIMSRKNVARMIQAYKMFVDSTGSNHSFVLAGKRLYDTQDVDEAIEASGLRDRIIELGYVPDEVLPALYSASSVFLYTTLWEGFGLPLLEAMACGTPVVSSNLSSIPEIAGDAAILVDPQDARSIAQALIEIHRNATAREDLVAAGFEQAGKFSWNVTASRTIEAYRSACSHRAS